MDSALKSQNVPDDGVQKTSKESLDAKTVRRICVEALFGQYDYDLVPDDVSTDISSILILYGDNGSGKTTILGLLFHLLSSSNKEGHRNTIARIPFRKFEVTLTDGTRISLWRNEELVGPYEILAEPIGRPAIKGSFGSAEKKSSFIPEGFERDFLGFLEGLNQSLYFLPADRTIVSDSIPSKDLEHTTSTLEQDMLRALNHPVSEEQRALRLEELRNVARANALALAMRISKEWIRNQALRATTRGAANANSIYVDILKRLSASPLFANKVPEIDHGQLVDKIREVALQSQEYSRFGFTSQLRIDEMLRIFSQSNDQTAPVIQTVLEQYINVNSARLDALKNLYVLTSTIIDNLNQFYTGKTVTFKLTDGFQIVRDDGKPIEPTWLSSGEQQLFLMFCHVLTCRDKRSIFIIDEPEISLNIKWKRNLITSLLSIAHGAEVQFIFASHSMELTSEHLDNVIKLKSRASTKVLQKAEVEKIGPASNS